MCTFTQALVRLLDITDDELDIVWNAYLKYQNKLKTKLEGYKKIIETNDIEIDDLTQIYRFEMMVYAVYKEKCKNDFIMRGQQFQQDRMKYRKARDTARTNRQQHSSLNSRGYSKFDKSILKKRSYGSMNDDKKEDILIVNNESTTPNKEMNNDDTELPPKKRQRVNNQSG